MLALIQNILQKYLDKYPEEKDDLELLSLQLTSETYESITTRKNFLGHITASAFIVDIQRKRCLMIEHATFHRFLIPGGHIEVGDTSLLEAAKREAEEETGIRNIVPIFNNSNEPVVIDIDSHLIPKNEKKNEAEHYHHDFRFLFRINDDLGGIHPNLDAVKSAKWIPISELDEYYPQRKGIAEKLMNSICE